MHNPLNYHLGLVLILGVLSQWVAWKWKLPSILILAIVGLIVGPVTGFIYPQTAFGPMYEPMIKLSIAIILFEGGLSLQFHELKEAGKGVKRLVTLNTIFTLLVVSVIARYLLQYNWDMALILASVLVITGPTVIIPMLRNAHLPRRISSYLKWEGILNDPVGVLLAVTSYEYLILKHQHSTEIGSLFGQFVLSMIVSIALPFILNATLTQVYKRGLIPPYLSLPLIFVSAIIVYTIPNLFHHEAGLVATTLYGMLLGNSKMAIISEVRRFKEYLTILIIPVVFILLTADVDLKAMTSINWRMATFFILLMFVLRPLTVFASTANTKIDFKDKLFISLIAPRGIVCAALVDFVAINLSKNGHAEAMQLVPMVFLIIFGSVLVNSLMINPLAKKLDLSHASERILIIGANPWTLEFARAIKNMGISVTVSDSNWEKLIPIKMDGIHTHYGEALSRSLEENMDLTDLGHIFAMTSNDAYNALVCSSYAQEIGHNRAHQVAFKRKKGQEYKESHQGGFVLGEYFTYDNLLTEYDKGGKFKVVDPSDGSANDIKAKTEAGVFESFGYPLLVKKANNGVIFNSTMIKMTYEPGDKVLLFCPMLT